MGRLVLVRVSRSIAEKAHADGKRVFGQGNAKDPYEIADFDTGRVKIPEGELCWCIAKGAGFMFMPRAFYVEELS